MAKQRTAEAAGAAPVYVPYVPKVGDTNAPRDLQEAADYYLTSRGQHPNAPNKMLLTSASLMIVHWVRPHRNIVDAAANGHRGQRGGSLWHSKESTPRQRAQRNCSSWTVPRTWTFTMARARMWRRASYRHSSRRTYSGPGRQIPKSKTCRSAPRQRLRVAIRAGRTTMQAGNSQVSFNFQIPVKRTRHWSPAPSCCVMPRTSSSAAAVGVGRC